MFPTVNCYHKELHLGCCSSPRSASVSGVFPENAKIALADNGKPNKNRMSIFRAEVVKDQLVREMSKYLPLIIFAYQQNYSNPNVLTYFLDSWKENLDNNFFTGVSLINLSKSFDCILHDLIIVKFYGCDFNKIAKDRK